MCVYVCICALKSEGYTCALACVWRSWKSLGCLHLPLFLKKIYFELHVFIWMSVCGYMPMSAVSAEFRRGCWSPRTRITSNCEPSDMGTGNQTLEEQYAALNHRVIF